MNSDQQVFTKLRNAIKYKPKKELAFVEDKYKGCKTRVRQVRQLKELEDRPPSPTRYSLPDLYANNRKIYRNFAQMKSRQNPYGINRDLLQRSNDQFYLPVINSKYENIKQYYPQPTQSLNDYKSKNIGPTTYSPINSFLATKNHGRIQTKFCEGQKRPMLEKSMRDNPDRAYMSRKLYKILYSNNGYQ